MLPYSPIRFVSDISEYFTSLKWTSNPKLWLVQVAYFTLLLGTAGILHERRSDAPLKCFLDSFHGGETLDQVTERCESEAYLFVEKNYERLRNLVERSGWQKGREKDEAYDNTTSMDSCDRLNCYLPEQPWVWYSRKKAEKKKSFTSGVLLYPDVYLIMAMLAIFPVLLQVWRDDMPAVVEFIEQKRVTEKEMAIYCVDLTNSAAMPQTHTKHFLASILSFLCHGAIWAVYRLFFGINLYTAGLNAVLIGADILEFEFPTEVGCLGYFVGPSGDFTTLTPKCVLPSHEFLRYTFIPLFCLSSLSLLGTFVGLLHLLLNYIPSVRRLSMKFYVIDKEMRKAVIACSPYLGPNEWFFVARLINLLPDRAMDLYLKRFKRQREDVGIGKFKV